MPHRIYHTDAIVLAALPRGEADRAYDLYTRELGCVRADARSIRREASRLRYALQTFAHAEVDLVRGKRGWRITSARPVDLHRAAWGDPRRRVVLAAIARLVLRLVQGEGADPELHAALVREIALLADTPLEPDALADRECVALVRILSALGYWDALGEWGYIVDHALDDASVLARVRTERRALIGKINAILKETQL
ncbi:MAG TPA: recombination protein O N-terminal domain-containing protein [Candidatus Paceibacterota bacterium]|nr:recombination protein O N-terminal domain-containing protein [Candidatus Paceibacterota bacterium]